MNEYQKEQIRQALEVESLTGKTIRSALLKAGAPTAILAAISVSGFGAFVALTTIIHAIFTTILGITLPFAVYTSATSILGLLTGPIGGILIFGIASYQILSGSRKLDRELCAQVVWCSVTSYGNQFTPRDEEMPSYLYGKEREIAEKENIIKNLIVENKKVDKENELLQQEKISVV
ncbi:hypothetical protein CLOACE_04520 [Clostridium acetireducens DSM 10703]|jgi:fumarate reductase subunit D|uniref:Uncharacterized protein n=1 Tax=Clostridium acetireducens DSM 10703 TaxID=1121290 RepID=A0A1E8F0U7_9CLOT|nr:hypothetical protein [Clostridium acetireducens]OFI07047.1 hypothetical protein CLOACE_04520 [Clostridium acetireducens DSM 10703]